MSHFKNGTIFVEVVVALAMVGIVLSSALSLQFSVLKRVIHNAFSFSRITSLDSFFQTVHKDRLVMADRGFSQKIVEKSIEDPEMKITFEKTPVNKKSSLARFTGLFKEESKGQWTEWSGQANEKVVSFVFIPAPKEKDEKSGGKA